MGISNIASNLRPGIVTSTTRPATPYEGQMVYETDTDKVLVWTGASWKGIPVITSSGSSNVLTASVDGVQGQMPHALAAGTINATTNTSYQNTFYGISAAITFPVGRFSQAPMTVASVASGGYGWASINSRTSTGISFIWLVADGNGVTRTINWVAIQMVSTAGNG